MEVEVLRAMKSLLAAAGGHIKRTGITAVVFTIQEKVPRGSCSLITEFDRLKNERYLVLGCKIVIRDDHTPTFSNN